MRHLDPYKPYSLLLLAIALLLSGCAAPQPFSEKQIAAGLPFAQGALQANLKQHVENLYNARINDPEKDATTYKDGCGLENVTCVFSHKAAAKTVIDFWKSKDLGLGVEPVVETTTQGGFENTNIYLDFRGSKQPQEFVILCGHYDAWFGGANDNGSGVAIVMEAARVLKGISLDRTIRLLILDGEELGGVGSYRYWKAHQNEKVRMVLNLDMIGHFIDRKAQWVLGDPKRFDFTLNVNDSGVEDGFKVAQLGKRLPQPVRLMLIHTPGNGLSGFAMAENISYPSDHLTFWALDWPALAFFPTGEVMEGYHTDKDTPDKLNYDRIEMLAKLALAAAGAFATNPQ